jgi:hypothetical protein
MSTRDRLETDTRVIDAPDAPREIPETENAVESPRGDVLEDPDRRREADAEYRQRVDGDWEPRKFEAPRAELAQFDLKRAGLPDFSVDSAQKYIDEHRGSRPWLAATDGASPEARRIIVAMDAAGIHPQIRHEGWVSEEANRRRVTYLEDPAQLDPAKRNQGIDGIKPNDKPHWCAAISTRIADPDAFATAFARGVERPQVQEALATSFDPGSRPDPVTVPISDLLGQKGHRHCTGWRLEPIDGSMSDARGNRADWLVAKAEGREPDVPEPQANPVPTFKDGVITFIFSHDHAERRYKVANQFIDPPATPEESDASVLLGASSGRAVRDAHCGRDELSPPGKLRS